MEVTPLEVALWTAGWTSAGWFVGHRLALARDRENALRAQKVATIPVFQKAIRDCGTDDPLWAWSQHKPNVEAATHNFRCTIPKKISMQSGIAQWSNAAAFISGLYTENYELIGRSVTDHVAEPFRAPLIPFFEEVKSAAVRNGALACSISGSGPSVFALTDNNKDAAKIADVMKGEFLKGEISCTAYVSSVNKKGVRELRT